VSETLVLAKVRRRLIPFLFLLYIIAYLDRINVGFAALHTAASIALVNSVGNTGARDDG